MKYTEEHEWLRVEGDLVVEAERLARMAVRDMVKDFSFYGPTAVLRALSNEMAGNREAALADETGAKLKKLLEPGC